MASFFKSGRKSFDLYSTHAFFTPGVGGMFLLFGLLLAGSLLGSVIVGIMSLCGLQLDNDWTMIVSYPCTFIIPMVFASYMGRNNMLFDKGYSLDSNNFSPVGGAVLAVACTVGVLGCSFMMDAVNTLLPPMPAWLEDMLKNLTGGNFWLNFICVSIFAPIFEEWLCRGMVLRGLLNKKKEDGSPLMSPALAIIISALFFGIIHLNPWQALPAFAIGLLMGYVYYKTGSLKLTMLMHFANNTVALVMGHIDSLKDAESFKDIMSAGAFSATMAACAVITLASILIFRKVATPRPEGGCDEVFPEVQ